MNNVLLGQIADVLIDDYTPYNPYGYLAKVKKSY